MAELIFDVLDGLMALYRKEEAPAPHNTEEKAKK
jgi:hypothetical protein